MKNLRKLFTFIRAFLGLFALAVFLTGVLTVIGMAPPILMRRLVNDVARQNQWGIFPLVMGLLFAVPVLRAFVNILNSLVLNRISQGIIARTRKRVFEHLMRLSLKFYSQTSTGSITQRLFGDVVSVSGVVTGGIIMIITDFIAVGFAVTIMLGLNWRLSLLTFALLPFYYLNYRFFSRRIKEMNSILRTNMDHISSMLQERLSAHELIQSYGQGREGGTHFDSQAKQVMDTSIRGATYSIAFDQVTAFINKVGNSLIYCAGCYYFIKGQLDYGGVIAFCAYATQLLGPVVRFSSVANEITQVGVSVDRINEILDREPAIRDLPGAEPIEYLKGDVALENVTFSYEGRGEVLEDLSLRIPAGQHVAVVGTAGAGRTTLAMLLRRFYEPESGMIEVDGKNIREYRLKDYRRSLALILPESAILDGTIRENLCYGDPDATEEAMVAVSRAIGLDEFVETLAEGYDTKLGTGGLKLSSGVQQRIGIARALIAAPFILVVDEATAALDPESAEGVIAAIRKAMLEKTCVIVVNRVLMARDADSVIVMDKGRIVETGRHDELITRPSSLYRTLFSRQYGQDRLPPVREGQP